MKLKKVSPIIAMLLVVLMPGCNKDSVEKSLSPGMSSENMSAALLPQGGKLAGVNLGVAGNFVILSKTGISTTGTTAITGDIGVSPAAATYITGFDLIMDASNTFSTSALLTGKVYAADYTDPTPATMTAAVSDMETAYTDAAGRAPNVTELGDGDISGMTLVPGVYKWGTGVLINGGVTLSGGANDIWIFQIAQGLTVGDGAIITLSRGAQAKNIFWQVAETVALGKGSHFEGIILGMTDITLTAGASINGRMLAQTDITLIANIVTQPYEQGHKKLKKSK